MGKWSLSVALALSLVCGMGCSKKAVEPETVKPLVPLKIGNSWSYQYVHWLDSSDSKWIWYDYSQWGDTIVRTQVIDGDRYFVFNGVSPCYGTGYSVIRDRGDGILMAEYVEGRIRDDIFFQYPPEPDGVYSYSTLDTKDTLEIATVRETITVGAGAFECSVYRYSDQSGTMWSYAFAPGVGMIRSTLFNNPGAGAEVVEGDTVSLTSYDFR